MLTGDSGIPAHLRSTASAVTGTGGRELRDEAMLVTTLANGHAMLANDSASGGSGSCIL